MLLLIVVLLLSSILFLLNNYAMKRTGIHQALFYFRCDGVSWIAETAWLNNTTGEVQKITTTSNWQDGVVSVLENGETIYHTKQPFSDRPNLERFHRIARMRFFLELKWKAIAESKNVPVVAR